MSEELYENPCDGCPSRDRSCKSKAKIPKGARFLVVAKGPLHVKQIQDGNHLAVNAMKVFKGEMERLGFDTSEFAYANSVRCVYDPQTYPAKEKREIEKRCREHLRRVIAHMKPDLIIPLGAEAAKAVHGRGVKITQIRGVAERLDELDTMVLALNDPMQVFLRPEHAPLFASDCNTFARLYDHDFDVIAAEQEILGDYQLIDDLQFLIDQDPTEIVFDLETIGTRFVERDKKILTMQFCTEVGRAYMLPWDHPESTIGQRQKQKIVRQLRELLCNKKRIIIGQNPKFDRNWLSYKLGIQIKLSHDTLMMAALVDENLQNKDLDTLTKIYAPEMGGYADSFNSKYDKSRMDLVPLDELVGYGCGDVDADYRVFKALKPQIEQDTKLWRHYRLVSMPGINAFGEIECRGRNIDEDALDDLEVVLSAQVDEQYKSLMKQVPRSIKRLHAEKGLKFSRKEFLLDILFYHPDGFKLKPVSYTKSTDKLQANLRIPSTSTKDHLPYFYEDCPFTLELSAYIKNERVLSTNVRSFREKYIHNGKVFPVYSLSHVVTGRTSSRDPNGQNYPVRGKVAQAYQRIFTVPPGYVQIAADLSQAELRISADMANDRVMIDIYNSGGDIHKFTACIVMGVSMQQFERLDPEEQALARFKAKAVNFGFIYGMGWRKFIVYAKTQYSVEFNEREARRIREGFFTTYPGLEPWHAAMRAFVMEHGYVRSYSGRIRHLPMVYSPDEGVAGEAQRQSINSPVQEFASSLGVMAAARLTQEIDPAYLHINGFVHDAIYAVVPEEYVEWGAKTLKHYMQSNPIERWFDRRLKIPIIADVAFGANGADMYEMKRLDLDTPYDFSPHYEEMEEKGFVLAEQYIPENDGRRELEDWLVIPEYARPRERRRIELHQRI